MLGTRVEAPRWAAALAALGERLSPSLWPRLVKAGLARAWADGGWSWVDEAARTAAKALIQGRLPDVSAACARVLEGEPDLALRLRRAQHLRAAGQPEVAWALLVTCANGLIYRGDRAAAARLCTTAAGLCDDLGLPRVGRAPASCCAGPRRSRWTKERARPGADGGPLAR